MSGAEVKEQHKISPFLVFYLVHTMQIGVGVMGFQRIVAKEAGNDAWISVLLAGISLHIVIFLMYKILLKENGDIIAVHKRLFGKWIGGLLSWVLIIYFIAMSLTVLRTYIEVVQVWMFPDLNKWIFGFVFLLLVYYCLSGGFKVVTGISFFGVVLPFYLLLTMAFPLYHGHFKDLLPILNHSASELYAGAKAGALPYLGFSTLLIYFPFIKDPAKSHRWAQGGHLLTIFIYVIVMIATITFFSANQLEKTVWATLTTWKIAEMPFVERFEYIGIATWALVVLPNICITVWAGGRGIRRLINVKQRTITIPLLILILIVNSLLTRRENIDMLNSSISNIGFYMIFVYIPLLFIFQLVLYKVRKQS
ncbi:GerAB/ArcD/ProY family transporter [Guptibacillus algicola]|uniref:GerAB/ArcD/ProY family transporter n=1 Tax=Guptibacillus algicola TaxID=225844 RepID=UPI001CD1B709|nr:GerAB/ArcD/ProY family transporter [Alkalihalobacillus algicola]MCA0989072.1 spore germination protein [Alkalihalobacillus algicola]